ncbi:MAG: MnhB domain-containing protein [Deltaproteobacteria bacterium]
MNSSPILTVTSRAAAPLMIVFAVVLYLKGHNAAGGGFIAGLLTAVAVLLGWLGGRPRAGVAVWPLFLIAAGLGLSLLVALGGAVAGHAAFTHAIWHLEVPVLGTLALPSAALFDLGIYLLVVGNVATVLGSMSEAG